MFKIGEFSKLSRVSVRMLRYYDETGLLKPALTDYATNYRLYSAEQLPVLNKIIFFRDLGFNVSEISHALSRRNENDVSALLEERYAEIEKLIKKEQDKLLKIEQAKKDITYGTMPVHYNVSIKEIPAYQVFSLRRIVPNYYSEGDLWKEMSEYAEREKLHVPANTFTIYHDAEYKEQDVDIEICAPVEHMEESRDGFVFRKTEAVPVMACTMVYGDFGNIAGAYTSFAAWLQEQNQYRMSGQSRQIVHREPWNEKNTDDYLTEIQIPLEKA